MIVELNRGSGGGEDANLKGTRANGMVTLRRRGQKSREGGRGRGGSSGLWEVKKKSGKGKGKTIQGATLALLKAAELRLKMGTRKPWGKCLKKIPGGTAGKWG